MTSLPTPSHMNNAAPKHNYALNIGNYRLGKTVGVGSFGKVKVAEHIYTGNKVAIKILNRRKIKNLRMDEKIRREIQNLKLFRHPHIIRLYEVIEAPTDIFMIMEYVPGGELFDYIVQNGKLKEDEGRKLFQQIVAGVEYCHSHMVVHRDLKPENLLLDSVHFSVKIADFGLSNMMQDGDFLKTSCGSPNYAAPEVISGKLYAGPEVDVWSCGVILYALLCAKLPFDDEYIPALFKKIRDGVFVIPDFISPMCADLIKRMLVVDPLKRITISEIRKHPWFTTKLPKYLSYAPLGVHRGVLSCLDPEIFNELLVKYPDQTKEDLLAELRDPQGNEFVVAYHLLLDARRNVLDENHEPVTQEESTTPPDMLSSLKLDTTNGTRSPSTTTRLHSSSTIMDHTKTWNLGVTSSLSPSSILQEMFRALQVCGFEWKVTGPYQLRCITRVGPRNSTVKLTLQLFKMQDNKYLLDIKKMEAQTFLYFDACSKLLRELHL